MGGYKTILLSFLQKYESPVHAVKGIPAYAGMTVFRTSIMLSQLFVELSKCIVCFMG